MKFCKLTKSNNKVSNWSYNAIPMFYKNWPVISHTFRTIYNPTNYSFFSRYASFICSTWYSKKCL